MKLDFKNHGMFDIITRNFPKHKRIVIPNNVYKEYINRVKFDINELNTDSFLTILKGFKNRKGLVYFTGIKGFVFEYEKTDNGLNIVQHFLYERPNEEEGSFYRFYWNIDWSNGNSSFKLRKDNDLEISERDRLLLDIHLQKDFKEDSTTFFLNNITELFIRSIIFIDLSKDRVKLVDIKSKGSYGNILKENYIKNELNGEITIVDSLWNTGIISVGEFKVRGHFRLQRCGIGYSEVKLIYIDEFIKTHYIRRSSRELSILN
jgi:hypothetical protein